MAVAGEEAGQVAESGVPAPVQKAIDDAIEQAVERIVALAVARIEELLAGEDNPIVKRVLAELEEHKARIIVELEQLAEAGAHKLEDEAVDPMVEWAHQKIDGLVTAIERAVGISVAQTLPPAPGEAAATHTVEVTGAEKASDVG